MSAGRYRAGLGLTTRGSRQILTFSDPSSWRADCLEIANGRDYQGDSMQEGTVDIGKGTAKGTKVTVHYTEEGGKKIAHFFE